MTLKTSIHEMIVQKIKLGKNYVGTNHIKLRYY